MDESVAVGESRSEGQITKPVCKFFNLRPVKMRSSYSGDVLLKRISHLYLENCKCFSKILLWTLACFPFFQGAVSFVCWNLGYLCFGYLTSTWHLFAFQELICNRVYSIFIAMTLSLVIWHNTLAFMATLTHQSIPFGVMME